MTSPMKPSEALRKARELLTPEGAWIQNKWASDEKGLRHLTGDEDGAVCFCALGALQKVKKTGAASIYPEEKYLRTAMCDGVESFNDDPGTTLEDVLDAFGKAIALAEAAGQ